MEEQTIIRWGSDINHYSAEYPLFNDFNFIRYKSGLNI